MIQELTKDLINSPFLSKSFLENNKNSENYKNLEQPYYMLIMMIKSIKNTCLIKNFKEYLNKDFLYLVLSVSILYLKYNFYLKRSIILNMQTFTNIP